ncbi:MAG TPA: DUF86 domain-containing protein [Phycisphaerales bacterium]|nr:DUF86 domain-containing protein [Phycisphaerales bacterium]
MRPERDRMLDILEAAERIALDCKGMTLRDFTANRLVRQAVERNLEIIGEAAKHLLQPTLARMPGIDWRGLCGIRDILIHSYFRTDPTIIWRVVSEECPAIIAAVRRELGM